MILLFQILYYFIRIYSLVLIVYALLSWFPGAYQSSIGRLVISLAEPVLKPLRRLHLQFAGLDWTVWVAILLLNGLTEFLIRLFAAFL
ncbi:YggT family protein [Streptococcus massiliensis]|nr:YggT family protein [Streptococcus massiliensis]